MTLILQRRSDLVNLDCLLRYILLRFSVPFLSGYANLAKLFYSLLPIVLAVTSSASSEDTPSTHRYKAKSAEFPPKCFRITSWIYFVVAWQLWRQDVVMSFRICLFFFLRCLVEMLVNAEQEMDSARDCKYKFSIEKTWISNKSRELSFWHSVYLTAEHTSNSQALVVVNSFTSDILFLFVRLLVFFCC